MSKNLDLFDFIECVRSQPFLYDKNHDEHRNTEKRQKVWDEVANQFGLKDGKEAYKKWKYLKDHFFAEKKKMKERGVDACNSGDYKKWQYYDALQWTENFLDKRKSRVINRRTNESIDHLRSSATSLMADANAMNLEECMHNIANAFNVNHNRTIFLSHDEKENNAALLRPLESVFAGSNSIGFEPNQPNSSLMNADCYASTAVNNGDELSNEIDADDENGGAGDVKPVIDATGLSTKQQQQLLHQTLVAESEEELFGRLVARDLVRLPAKLRPLARLKIQELLYHFSIGHVPELN